MYNNCLEQLLVSGFSSLLPRFVKTITSYQSCTISLHFLERLTSTDEKFNWDFIRVTPLRAYVSKAFFKISQVKFLIESLIFDKLFGLT